MDGGWDVWRMHGGMIGRMIGGMIGRMILEARWVSCAGMRLGCGAHFNPTTTILLLLQP